MANENLTENLKDLKLTNQQDINILLLGETGVGKSTFVNSVANYLHYKEFKKAAEEELLILIPSFITVIDENSKSISIPVGSKDKNEYQEIGAAATQDVKTYVFPINQGKTRLRFIDSPGLADPRGIKQDNINLENILRYLSQLKELHAICFLMKPTNTRITVNFEYCMKEILSRLEKSASKNIIFIFTNARGSNYTPGETLPCLRKVVEDIKNNPPYVEIPLEKNLFSLDNEAFRYLVATKNNIKQGPEIEKNCIGSWEKSSKECWRLITYIVGGTNNDPLKPHQLQNTMSINEARRLVIQLSKPLADITQLIYDNLRILDRHRNNLRMDNQTLDQLKTKLFIPTVDLEVTELTQPVTVCTSTKCAKMVKVGDKLTPHYVQRCHDPCYLTCVQKEIIGDPNLQCCAAMNGSKICSKCTCNFLVHMHVYYMSKTVEKRIVDENVQKNINQKEEAVREAHRLIAGIDRRKKELEEEREIIVKSTAQFAHFLQNNAITPFNDSYKKYIEYLIEREEALGRCCDLDVVVNLKQLLRQYEETKAAFDKSLLLTTPLGLDSRISSQITAQTVITTIHKLYALKHNGKKIHEMIKKQKTSRNSEYDKNCEYVHPKTTGLYNIDKKKDKKKDKEEKLKKDKKKDGKSTDDELFKSDKKFTKTFTQSRGNYRNQGNRTYGQSQYGSNTSTFYNQYPDYNQQRNSSSNQELPPPYPGYSPYNNVPRKKSLPEDDKPEVLTLTLELPRSKKEDKSFNRQDSYPRQDPYYPSQNYVPPYHAPSGYPPYHPPPPPPQGPYQGYYTGGPYQGPPQENYYGPPPNQYPGPSNTPYHGPPQSMYHGPQYHGYPQNPYHGAPAAYSGPRGGYQKNKHYGGRPNPSRGGIRRGKPKSRGDKSKKSGTEKSGSDSGSN